MAHFARQFCWKLAGPTRSDDRAKFSRYGEARLNSTSSRVRRGSRYVTIPPRPLRANDSNSTIAPKSVKPPQSLGSTAATREDEDGAGSHVLPAPGTALTPSFRGGLKEYAFAGASKLRTSSADASSSSSSYHLRSSPGSSRRN